MVDCWLLALATGSSSSHEVGDCGDVALGGLAAVPDDAAQLPDMGFVEFYVDGNQKFKPLTKPLINNTTTHRSY